MEKEINLVCHDCCQTLMINNQDEEVIIEDLKFCPFCGSDNIDVE